MAASYTQFKSVFDIGASLVSDQLEANCLAWVDWSLLQIGGFFNVTFPAQGTRLRRASDPALADGRVYEGYRQNWVWESGIAYNGYDPVPVSGVWVTAPPASGGAVSFLPVNSGYYIDYPLGRVVFDDPLPSGYAVGLEYSFKRVRLAAADAGWFQQLQFGTLATLNDPDPQFQQAGSGAWDVLGGNRVQLPAVVVEAVNRVRLAPFEIGSQNRVHSQDVLFHIIAETNWDRKQLHDIFVNQYNMEIQLFDKNAVEDADAWPLDWRGSPGPSGMQYPDLVRPTGQGGFRWLPTFISDVRSEPHPTLPPLYRATCRLTFEIDLP